MNNYHPLLPQKCRLCGSSNIAEVFNLANGKQHTIGEMVNIVKEISNSNKEPNYGTISIKQYEPKIREADVTKTRNTFKINTMDVYEGLLLSYNRYLENETLYQQ